MQLALAALLLGVVGCQGAQSNWPNNRAEPEHWKCLPLGDICSLATEPLGCCAGHCCSDGRCKPCSSATVEGIGSPRAGLQADLFTDFTGRQFNFPVNTGEVYSLFTEADHQLNLLFHPDNQQTRELGITMRGVGIHGPDTGIRVFATDTGKLQVEINDRPFRGKLMRLDGVTVSAGCPALDCSKQGGDDSAVTVKDSFMTLWIWAQTKGSQQPTLNFNATVTGNPLSQVHGILGQSLESHGTFVAAAPKTRVALPANLQFYGEGQPSDYSTTDLFSSDSTFSVFTRKLDRRRHRRKRSMLEGNALASLALASREASRGQQHHRYVLPRA